MTKQIVNNNINNQFDALLQKVTSYYLIQIMVIVAHFDGITQDWLTPLHTLELPVLC